MLIAADRSCLLVIDLQARLLPVIDGAAPVVANTTILLRAAACLGVPVLASEQYPKGLGPTVPEIGRFLSEDAVLEKRHFACTGDAAWMLRFQDLGRPQAVVAGTEAHVCVLQTALGLRGQGYQVFVVADATASRTPENRALALERLRAAGCAIVSTEMVLFEWMARAGTPEFKEVSALIK